MLDVAQTRLEDKAGDNASLQRQLESAILDIKRHKEQEREHISLTVIILFAFCRTTQCLGAAFASATWLSVYVCHDDVLYPRN